MIHVVSYRFVARRHLLSSMLLPIATYHMRREKQPRRCSVERLAGETTDGVFMNSELDKEGNLSVEAFTRWFLTMQNAQEASKASSSEATSSDAVAAAGA